MEDDEEESSFTRFNSLASRRVRDADDVAKLFQQLNKYGVFRVHAALLDPALAEDDDVAIAIPLVSLATKDIAPSDVVSDLLTAEDRGKQHLVSNVQKRLIDGSVRFHDSIKKLPYNFFQEPQNPICSSHSSILQVYVLSANVKSK